MAAVCRISVAAALVFAISAPAATQTREFLDAPDVRTRIRIQWDASKKKVTWAVDESSRFLELPPDKLFLTKTTIFVTYPRLNPLRLQATASVTAADDPAQATIAQLIGSVVSVASMLRPSGGAADPTAAETGCPAIGLAAVTIGRLTAVLHGDAISAANIRNELASWTGAIDAGFNSHSTGAGAIGDAIKLITSDTPTKPGLLPLLERNIRDANALLATVEEGAQNPNASCDRTLYRLVVLTNPRARIQQLQSLKAALAQLVALLTTQYGDESRWDGTDYEVSDEITPTQEKLRNVTVKIATIAPKVDEASSALTLAPQDAGSASFSVRKYATLTPEIGVGAVFGLVDRPKYGTAKNAAGDTIVARVPDDEVSIQPSVLVNFVCRCAAGALAPMVQIGAAVSKELPGILLGGGLRLFGASKGNVAIGGGWMLAWVKDLQKLKEGDVVTGTKDIEADLGYATKPRGHGYFVIQYKF